MGKRGLAGLLGVVFAIMSSGIAVSEPAMRTEVEKTVEMADGSKLTLSLTRMSITPVPNMGANPFTKEGFFSATASARVHNVPPGIPKPLPTVTIYADLSCQLEFAEEKPYVGNFNPGYADSPLGALNPTQPDNVNIALDPTVTLGQQQTLKIKPTTPNHVELGSKGPKDPPVILPKQERAPSTNQKTQDTKVLEARQARRNARLTVIDPTVSVRNMRVARERCTGPVVARLRASAESESDGTKSSVEVLGDAVPL